MDVLERIDKDGLRVSVSYGVMEEFDWREDGRLSNELLELAKLGKQSQHRERVLREALMFYSLIPGDGGNIAREALGESKECQTRIS